MSGLDEQIITLPTCCYCNKVPGFYTLGKGDGDNPMVWCYSETNAFGGERVSYGGFPIKGKQTCLKKEVEYAYCSDCSSYILKSKKPEILNRIVNVCINLQRGEGK